MSQLYLRAPAGAPWDQMGEAEQEVTRQAVSAKAEAAGLKLRPADHPIFSVKQLTPGAYWLMWQVVDPDDQA